MPWVTDRHEPFTRGAAPAAPPPVRVRGARTVVDVRPGRWWMKRVPRDR